MIGDLKPYAEYKDSGLPWLGQAPAHWEFKRNGSLFQQRNTVGEPDWRGKQFVDNESFRRAVTDMVFAIANQ